MKIAKLLSAAFTAAFFIASAHAQNGTATNHAFLLGKGAGVQGYTSLLCASAQLAVGQSAADPICKTITGDVTLSAAGAVTLNTVNSNVGSFGSATASPTFTVNAKGLITAASSNTITPAIGSITGLGTGCATFLGTPSSANLRACLTDEVGTGAAYFIGGALGTPASATLTNATGLPLSGLTTQAANTIVANATGSAASPTAVDISTLTAKASPAASDLVLISDQAASGALKKATISSIASAGSVSSLNGQTGALIGWQTPGARITLTSGVAIMTSTVTAANTVIVTPSGTGQIGIYNGTNVVPTVFAEVSQLTTDTTKSPAAVTTNSNYDVFCWIDSGTNRCTRGPAWTTNTARGTGAGTSELDFTTVPGLPTNKNAITNGPAANRGVYMGTIHSNGTSTIDYIVGGSASGGTAVSLGVWNMWNPNQSAFSSVDSGTSYTYNSNTPRQARASAGNQISFVVGLSINAIEINYQTRIATAATAASFGTTCIGEDSTSTCATPRGFVFAPTAAAVIGSPPSAVNKVPLLGYHTYAAVEACDAAPTTVTFNGDSNATLSAQVWN